MITIWNWDGPENPYELKCRDDLIRSLILRKQATPLHLVFSVRYKSEECDMVLFGPSGFVIGELKEIHGSFQGSYNGHWKIIGEDGRPSIFPRKRNPFTQVMIQRKVFSRALGNHPGLVRRTNPTSRVEAQRYCSAGVVCPRGDHAIRGIDDPWWYIRGFDGWLDFAVTRVTRAPADVIDLDSVAGWLEHMGCPSIGLNEARELADKTDQPPATAQPVDLQETPTDHPLDGEQSLAVHADFDRHLAIVAGPGAGKTHVLVHRIRKLIEQLGSDEWMAVITYTNAASNELRERLRINKDLAGRVQVGTVHSFARHLEQRIDPDARPANVLDQQIAQKRFAQACDIAESEAKRILDAITSSSQDQLTKDDRRLYESFKDHMNADNDATFEMLLENATRAASSKKGIAPRHLVIDEYQDSTSTQNKLFRSLAENGSTITAVGDPEQAIFTDGEHLTTFSEDFPGSQELKLRTNRRSSAPIVAFANATRGDKDQLGGQVPSRDNPHSTIILEEFKNHREQDERIVEWITENGEAFTFDDCAILARERRTCDRIKRKLRARDIPAHGRDDAEYHRLSLTKRLIATLELAGRPDDLKAGNLFLDTFPGASNQMWTEVRRASAELRDQGGRHQSLKECIGLASGSMPNQYATEWKRYLAGYYLVIEAAALPLSRQADFIWKEIILPEIESKDEMHIPTLEQVVEGATTMAVVGTCESHDQLCTAIRNGRITINGGEHGSNGVLVSTIHSFKGLQKRATILADVTANILPSYRASMDPKEFIKERRVLHVGVSRAQEYLAVFCPERVERRQGGKSPFLEMLNEAHARSRSATLPDAQASKRGSPGAKKSRTPLIQNPRQG
jgi:DNA helicase-2/ATP-dependent DNA helicase PcrA